MKSITPVSLFAAMYSVRSAAAEPIPVLVERLGSLTYEGCYSSSQGLQFSTSYIYNTKTSCQQQCAPAGNSVQATTNKTDCWCGNNLPPSTSKVADSFCNDPCAGFDKDMCGAAGSTYFSVYLTGSGTLSSSSADTSSSATSAPTSSATTSAKPSVVTVGGAVTVTASSSTTPSASPSSKSSGPSKAGIAAGVVIGVVAIAAIAGGVLLFLRNKRRHEVEEEYKRNAAVASFVAGGKPPTSSAGGSSFLDTRLDPVMAQRRMSDGSIADNQDYSRRILKVTNA